MLIVESCTSTINLKVGMSLGHSVSLRFVFSYFEHIWVAFQTKNSVKIVCEPVKIGHVGIRKLQHIIVPYSGLLLRGPNFCETTEMASSRNFCDC